MMQELAPEIKAIKEKYKNDLEKQAQAQRELWKKHNFNPLGGCWLMFLQLPIFIGLYRSLSVDIELRQAPLIPGLDWCSNLAAPDMFWHWETPSLAFITGQTGWLGPYLNILPIVTIADTLPGRVTDSPLHQNSSPPNQCCPLLNRVWRGDLGVR